MPTEVCAACPLGLSLCWARDVPAPRVCELVRGELEAEARGETPGTTYQHLVRERSGATTGAQGAEPPLPPLATMATNAGGALVRAIAAGFRRPDEAAVAGRLAVCRGCDRYRPSDKRCSECGCFVELKAGLAAESCPLDRWPGRPGAPASVSAPSAGCGCGSTPTA